MLALHRLKKEIEELEDYIEKLERYLETHTRRLNFLLSVSYRDSRITYSHRLAKLQREVNLELAFERRSLARLKDQLADLAA